MTDLHLHRPPDRAARPARPAARARRHRPQHRQRQHRRLLAPGGRARRRRSRCAIGRRAGRRRRRPCSAGRRRRGLPPHARRLPRPPVPRAEHGARRATRPPPRSLGQVELALAEPGDNGIGAAARQVLERVVDVANYPEHAGHPPGAGRPGRRCWPTAIQSLDARPRSSSQPRPTTQYAQITGPTGDVLAAAQRDRAAQRGDRARGRSAGAPPNDLLDRRDLAARQAQRPGAGLGHRRSRGGSIRVNFGDAATPLVDDATVDLAAGADRPGRQARRAASTSATRPPTGTVTAYRTTSTRSPRSCTTASTPIHGTPDFFTGTAGAEATDHASPSPPRRSAPRTAAGRRRRQRHRARRSPPCAAAPPTSATPTSSPASAPTSRAAQR